MQPSYTTSGRVTARAVDTEFPGTHKIVLQLKSDDAITIRVPARLDVQVGALVRLEVSGIRE